MRVCVCVVYCTHICTESWRKGQSAFSHITASIPAIKKNTDHTDIQKSTVAAHRQAFVSESFNLCLKPLVNLAKRVQV